MYVAWYVNKQLVDVCSMMYVNKQLVDVCSMICKQTISGCM